MGARADDAHVAEQHIEKLGKLVDAQPPQPIAAAKYPGIVAAGLASVAVVVDVHGPVFVNRERAAQHAVAHLFEEQGAGRKKQVNEPDEKVGERQDEQVHRESRRQDRGAV